MSRSTLLILFAGFSALTTAYIPNFDNYKVKDLCINESGILGEMVEMLMMNPYKELSDLESCFLHCVYTELGYLSEDGTLMHNRFEELKNTERPEIDLDCLQEIEKLEHCNEMMKLRACQL